MPEMQDFGLYLIITKPKLSYGEIARIAVKHNIRYLQLREKHLSDRALLAAAREIKRITRNTTTQLVINDRPDIALLADADCLHLGQDDLSIQDARKIVGEKMAIGLSTHSIRQAEKALQHNPAYIGFGPIYPTPTKANPDPPVGTDKIAEVVKMAAQKQIPVVAVGGIFPQHIYRILDAGAQNLCMVRYLMESTHIEERVMEISKSIQERKK